MLDQPLKGDKNLMIINEDTDEFNLSDVSISDQESLENNDSADDQPLPTPTYKQFNYGERSEDEEEEYYEPADSLEPRSMAGSKEDTEYLRPIPPEVFAKEFRKAQE